MAANLRFFVEDHDGATGMAVTAERFFCGVARLVRSTRPDPRRCLGFSPFDKSLDSIAVSVAERVKKLLLPEEEWRDTKLDFNLVEVGSEMGAGICGSALDESGK